MRVVESNGFQRNGHGRVDELPVVSLWLQRWGKKEKPLQAEAAFLFVILSGAKNDR
jgi:hypothetical protein